MSEAIPMCVMCGDREVQIVVNSAGSGYCSPECEASYQEDESWDANEEPVGSYNLSDDGDAGFGTDKDYGYLYHDIDY